MLTTEVREHPVPCSHIFGEHLEDIGGRRCPLPTWHPSGQCVFHRPRPVQPNGRPTDALPTYTRHGALDWRIK